MEALKARGAKESADPRAGLLAALQARQPVETEAQTETATEIEEKRGVQKEASADPRVGLLAAIQARKSTEVSASEAQTHEGAAESVGADTTADAHNEGAAADCAAASGRRSLSMFVKRAESRVDDVQRVANQVYEHSNFTHQTQTLLTYYNFGDN